MDLITMGQSTTIFGVLGHFQHGDKQPHNPGASLDMAPRPSISIVIWILSSDTGTSAATPLGPGARKVLTPEWPDFGFGAVQRPPNWSMNPEMDPNGSPNCP